MFQPLPSRQPHPLPGSPMNGVLEGRGRLAGGETTGSSVVMDVAQGRAPAGAREACANPTPAVMPGVFGRFSRPSRALAENAWGDRADPVVAPPANVFRASGTLASQPSGSGQPGSGTFASRTFTFTPASGMFVMGASTLGEPIFGACVGASKRQAISNLNPVLQPR